MDGRAFERDSRAPRAVVSGGGLPQHESPVVSITHAAHTLLASWSRPQREDASVLQIAQQNCAPEDNEILRSRNV